ncbi:MAG: hypothetical protein R2748_22305 [Bryobacterales bacterium]
MSSAPATTSIRRGFLQSFDPETGKRQWITYFPTPMKAGDPGLDTWPSLDAAQHGSGQVWIPSSYDPETRLYICGTGNPTPGYTGAPRPGDNLFTCTLMAVDVDAGKLKWYFRPPRTTRMTGTRRKHRCSTTRRSTADAPARLDGGAQRLLLHAGPRDGRAC